MKALKFLLDRTDSMRFMLIPLEIKKQLSPPLTGGAGGGCVYFVGHFIREGLINSVFVMPAKAGIQLVYDFPVVARVATRPIAPVRRREHDNVALLRSSCHL